MLDVGNATALNSQDSIEKVWHSMASRAELPIEPEKFFAKSGRKLAIEQRAFVRHYLRCKAILKCDSETHAIYMKDCSRNGMGFISPVQLFPCDQIQLFMPPGRSYKVEVVRCRRIGERCYECGCVMILS